MVEEVAGESREGQNQQDVELAAQREAKGADANDDAPPIDAGLAKDRPDDAELEAKFRQCAAWGGLPPAETDRVAALVWRLEELADVGA